MTATDFAPAVGRYPAITPEPPASIGPRGPGGTAVPSCEEIEQMIVVRLAAEAGLEPGQLHDELRSADTSLPVDPAETAALLPQLLAYYRVELRARDVAASLY